MELVYRPDGQEEQRWRIDLGKLRTGEIEVIERQTGWDYAGAYRERLLTGSVIARRVLLWILQRRAHPHLKLADVDFAADELVLEHDLDELRSQRETLAEASGVDELTRSFGLRQLDDAIAEKTAAEADDDTSSAPARRGKGTRSAASSDSATATG